MTDDCVSLLVTVPVCSFRKGYAREFLETEEIPPPSTVYGFLLSLVGEEERLNHVGTEIAYAVLIRPETSVVLRTVWRVKDGGKGKETAVGIGVNRRPDYQEVLTGLAIGIWIKPGRLAERIRLAGAEPGRIDRFGGLSLGESKDLVNDVVWSPGWTHQEAQWVVGDVNGNLPLPVWVDHVGSKDTVWKQFRLTVAALETPQPDDPRWVEIIAPEAGKPKKRRQ